METLEVWHYHLNFEGNCFSYTSVSCQHVCMEFKVINVTITLQPGIINYSKDSLVHSELEEKLLWWINLSGSIKQQDKVQCIHKTKQWLQSVHASTFCCLFTLRSICDVLFFIISLTETEHVCCGSLKKKHHLKCAASWLDWKTIFSSGRWGESGWSYGWSLGVSSEASGTTEVVESCDMSQRAPWQNMLVTCRAL